MLIADHVYKNQQTCLSPLSLVRLLRLFWWLWWSSACPGCLITWCTCGSSLAPSPWTRRPSCSVWRLTVWPTATRLLIQLSMRSSQRTLDRHISRCSVVTWLLSALQMMPERWRARQKQHHPPTAPLCNSCSCCVLHNLWRLTDAYKWATVEFLNLGEGKKLS